jgi:hypothetical protein
MHPAAIRIREPHEPPEEVIQHDAVRIFPVVGGARPAISLPVTTAVTCPLSRIHPAIVAQAAATPALLTGGRFTLGIGTGEALNEHILGKPWPSAEDQRPHADRGAGRSLSRAAVRPRPAPAAGFAAGQRGSSGGG